MYEELLHWFLVNLAILFCAAFLVLVAAFVKYFWSPKVPTKMKISVSALLLFSTACPAFLLGVPFLHDVSPQGVAVLFLISAFIAVVGGGTASDIVLRYHLSSFSSQGGVITAPIGKNAKPADIVPS